MSEHAELYITGGDAQVMGEVFQLAGQRWPGATVGNGKDGQGRACYVLRVPVGDPCEHPSWTGVDMVALDDPEKLWCCDVCGAIQSGDPS